MTVPLRQGERAKREEGNFPCPSATKSMHPPKDIPGAAWGYLDSQLDRNYYIRNLSNCLDLSTNLSPGDL